MKTLFTLVLLCLTTSAYAQTDDSPTADQMKEQFAKFARGFEAIDMRTQEKFEMVPRSVSSWSNPERKTLAGGLFLWTSQSRPVFALCMYPNEGLYECELQSLTDRELRLSRGSSSVWRPSEPGITWKDFPKGTQAPHQSPLVRRRQMKQLATHFKVTLLRPDKPELDLRMQAAPVYRYPAEKLAADCIDGSMFSFVQGTDPELLLMIEAVKDDSGKPKFRYAMGRTTIVPMKVHRESELVYEGTWPIQGYDAPYTVLKVARSAIEK